MRDFFTDISMKANCSENKKRNSFTENQESGLLSQKIGGNVPVPITPEAAAVMSVADITKESIRCFTEYAKCKEHEITERKRINAALKAVMYQIDAQKEVYLKELEKNYEDRNRLYDLAEKAQQVALENGDKEILRMTYNFILEVYLKPVGNTGGMPALLNGACNPL